MITGNIYQWNLEERLAYFKKLELSRWNLEKIKKVTRRISHPKRVIFNIYGKDDGPRLRLYLEHMGKEKMPVNKKFVHCLTNLKSIFSDTLIVINLPDYDAGAGTEGV